tara:strand:+ start:523 stop:1056 length:534 start_codon:yes stop_codon:yes gene_type:complete
MSKLFVESNQFQNLSLDLAKKIESTNLKPDVIIGVSRGGCIPGIIVHEYLNYSGIKCDYYTITTKLYNNDNSKGNKVFIDMSEYTKKQLKRGRNILIVDDVFDTGYTMLNVVDYMYKKLSILSDQIKIATIYYKPNKNETIIKPHFYIQERDEWIVLPHELVGLSEEEVEFKNRLIS